MTDVLNEPLEVQEHIKSLNLQYIRANNEAMGVLDLAAKEKRALSGEEQQKIERIDADMERITSEREVYAQRETRQREYEAMRVETESAFGAPRVERAVRSEAEQLRSFILGQHDQPIVTRAAAFDDGNVRSVISIPIHRAMRERQMIRQGMDLTEARALAWDTGNVASTVPVTTARTLYQVLEANIAALRMPTYRLTTNSGEQMKLPKLSTHAIATQVSGQGTTLAGTDPAFASTTLDAFKYGELVRIANEVVTDSGVDIVSIVTNDVGRAIGRKIDTDIVSGSGSGQPNGMVNITGAGTIATGGSLIDPTYEKLVDLVYSVNDAYRSGGNAAFLMRDATAGVLRKLRDGAGGTVGAVLWNPSLTNGIQGGQPDQLLGFPVYTDPNVASLASNAVIMAFGDWNGYVFRTVGNLMLESDASRYFDTDELGVRGKWRADGDYQDTTAVNIMKRSV